MQLRIDSVPSALMPTARYASAALLALAREEALGRRPKRLLEPGLATWKQFCGRMGARELVELLCEDAAVTQPSAFALPDELRPLRLLPAEQVRAWVERLPDLGLDIPGQEYVEGQAKRLGLPTRMARAGLHKVRSHQKVLELPGSGGQLSYFVASRDGLFLKDVFTIACSGWADATLAGLISVELGLSGQEAPIVLDPTLEGVREAATTFDFVLGLERDKGGLFGMRDLQEWFPHGTVLLV